VVASATASWFRCILRGTYMGDCGSSSSIVVSYINRIRGFATPLEALGGLGGISVGLAEAV
jgi:hypothetical protein